MKKNIQNYLKGLSCLIVGVGLVMAISFPEVNAAEQGGHIIVINPLLVAKGREQDALAEYWKYSEYFGKQPGYVSSKIHRAINPEAKFYLVNIAVWKSAAHFQAALNSLELKKMVDVSTASGALIPNPGLYEVIQAP